VFPAPPADGRSRLFEPALGPEPGSFRHRFAAEHLHQDPVHAPVVQDVDEVPQHKKDVALPGHRVQVPHRAVEVRDGRHTHEG